MNFRFDFLESRIWRRIWIHLMRALQNAKLPSFVEAPHYSRNCHHEFSKSGTTKAVRNYLRCPLLILWCHFCGARKMRCSFVCGDSTDCEYWATLKSLLGVPSASSTLPKLRQFYLLVSSIYSEQRLENRLIFFSCFIIILFHHQKR